MHTHVCKIRISQLPVRLHQDRNLSLHYIYTGELTYTHTNKSKIEISEKEREITSLSKISLSIHTHKLSKISTLL